MEIRNKKKVGILSIAALAGITIIGSSVAYFTSTDTKDNLFTVGSVRTILHEDRWDDLADTDHNGIPDMAEDIIPNKTIPKDPTIENTGKNPAWVYLEVRVPIVNIITAGGQRTDDHRQEHGHPAGGDRNNGGSLWKLHQPGTCYEGTCTADARRWRSSCG